MFNIQIFDIYYICVFVSKIYRLEKLVTSCFPKKLPDIYIYKQQLLFGQPNKRYSNIVRYMFAIFLFAKHFSLSFVLSLCERE